MFRQMQKNVAQIIVGKITTIKNEKENKTTLKIYFLMRESKMKQVNVEMLRSHYSYKVFGSKPKSHPETTAPP